MDGFTPAVERLRANGRRLPPWLSAPRTEAVTSDLAALKRARRGILVDLDETLYPRERFVDSGFAAVARHAALRSRIPVETAFRVLAHAHAGPQRGREFQALCARLGLPSAEATAMLDVYRRHLPSIWLGHGVAAALQRLRAGGWRIGVLTNGLPSVQFRKVAALGLTALVDDVVYAEEHAPGGKPSAAAFRAALHSLDLLPDHCVFVGDDPARDIRGARAAGMRTIRLARPEVTPAAADEADLVIRSFSELPDAAVMMLDAVAADVA